MKLHILYLFFSVLLCMSPAVAEFAVDPSNDDQIMPDIDGSVVVWAEYISEYGDYDSLGIDLESSAGYIYIVGLENDQTDPQISGTRVTWQNDFYGDGSDHDIELSDISNPDGILRYPVAATEGVSETDAAIHGTTIVWQADTGQTSDWNILGADTADPNVPFYYSVDTIGNDQTNPAVYRNRVIYQDDTGAHWDIWSADIWLKDNPIYDAVVTDETSGALDQTEPAVWGDTVVFEQSAGGSNMDIFAADLSDPADPVLMVVCDDSANQTAPNIWGHIVIWQDDRNGDWDIYGYNLVTKKEFRITDNEYDQTDPAISGDTVVWVDLRDTIPTIWAAYMDPVDIADCPSPPAGDTNGDCKVNLTDLSNFAENWLACDLDPAEACTN